MEFSVLNESSLHNTLKTFYSVTKNGKTEVKKDGHIFDILTPENEVIEIQTQNLGKLKNKISDTLDKGYKVRLVYPLIISRTIFTNDDNGNLISKRKSPKKGNIYDLFTELTGIYPILLRDNFTLEVVEINMSEQRLRTEENVQSKNKRRRFRKNWIKTNKHLDEILNSWLFNSKEDYLNLLPKNLPAEFCVKDIQSLLIKEKKLSKNRINCNLIAWVLSHMNLIVKTKTEKRCYYYKIEE